MGKLTIWKDKKAVAKKTENSVKQRDFASTMQALHKASGYVERRIIPMRCATHDKAFAVIYKRGADDLFYHVEKVAKEAPQAAIKKGILARHFSGESGNSRKGYDASEFDHAGRTCPWCDDATVTVQCGSCNETYCASTVEERADGSRYHECVSRCGNKGVLTSTESLNGHQAKAMRAKTSKALSGSSTKKLGVSGQKLLPGKSSK